MRPDRLPDARQAGVVTRAQCLAAGLTDEHLEARLGQGRWRRLESGLYVTHAGPLLHEARLHAAVLGVGPPVALARKSALWWADRDRPPARDVHLSVPRGRHVAVRPRVVVRHDMRPWTAWRSLDPPVTSVEDAVLDIAAMAPSAREVEAVVCETVRRRRTHPVRLAAALALRPRHPRRALLTAMLTEVAEGAQSPLELLDLRNDRRHGLPTAHRQVRQRVGGLGRWLDATLAPPGVLRPVQKELDGRLGHEDAAGRFRDMARDNDAALLGRDSLRYGWHDLDERGCEVAGQTLFLLQVNGYHGSGRPCGPSCALGRVLAGLRARRRAA